MLAETHELCPTVTYGWANQSYADELVEWVVALLGITLAIVKRPAALTGFVVLARRWAVDRTIAWLTRCQPVSKDFKQQAKHSAAMVYWALGVHSAHAPPTSTARTPRTAVYTQTGA